MARLSEGWVTSREVTKDSRQYEGIRHKSRVGGLGWLENPDEGAAHKKRGCREDVQLDERER